MLYASTCRKHSTTELITLPLQALIPGFACMQTVKFTFYEPALFMSLVPDLTFPAWPDELARAPSAVSSWSRATLRDRPPLPPRQACALRRTARGGTVATTVQHAWNRTRSTCAPSHFGVRANTMLPTALCLAFCERSRALDR